MRNIWIFVLAIVAAPGCEYGQVTGTYADLMIRNVTVVSVGRDTKPDKTNVLVRGGNIVFIGDSIAGQISDATTILDGTDRFLIPGLIDGHTHLNEVPGMTLEHEMLFPEIAVAARNQIPRSYLYHGFTTVVDLNSHPQTIASWNSQTIRPQAYFCGASPVFDGYPMSFMPKSARYKMMPYFLFDESRAEDFPEEFDPRRHSPEAVVERIQIDGGICVKTHYERGFGGRGNLPIPTRDLIQTLVEAAHNKGMPVLMHANSEAAQSFGVDTGIDAFAHGMWTWNDRTATELNAEVRKIVDTTIERGIALQPTIQVLYGEQDIHNSEYLADPRLAHVVPASLLAWYRTGDGQWWRQRMLKIPVVAQLVEQGHWNELDAPPIARVSNVLGHFATNGGLLLFGSDTPSDPTFANPPGLNGRFEMDRWITAGVSPLQLFAAATVVNAEFYGLDDKIGTIALGKRADLLLLRKNPLVDVSAYDTIEYIILGGTIIERSTLSAD